MNHHCAFLWFLWLGLISLSFIYSPFRLGSSAFWGFDPSNILECYELPLLEEVHSVAEWLHWEQEQLTGGITGKDTNCKLTGGWRNQWERSRESQDWCKKKKKKDLERPLFWLLCLLCIPAFDLQNTVQMYRLTKQRWRVQWYISLKLI